MKLIFAALASFLLFAVWNSFPGNPQTQPTFEYLDLNTPDFT
jgi:hypothetical protein